MKTATVLAAMAGVGYAADACTTHDARTVTNMLVNPFPYAYSTALECSTACVQAHPVCEYWNYNALTRECQMMGPKSCQTLPGDEQPCELEISVDTMDWMTGPAICEVCTDWVTMMTNYEQGFEIRKQRGWRIETRLRCSPGTNTGETTQNGNPIETLYCDQNEYENQVMPAGVTQRSHVDNQVAGFDGRYYVVLRQETNTEAYYFVERFQDPNPEWGSQYNGLMFEARWCRDDSRKTYGCGVCHTLYPDNPGAKCACLEGCTTRMAFESGDYGNDRTLPDGNGDFDEMIGFQECRRYCQMIPEATGIPQTCLNAGVDQANYWRYCQEGCNMPHYEEKNYFVGTNEGNNQPQTYPFDQAIDRCRNQNARMATMRREEDNWRINNMLVLHAPSANRIFLASSEFGFGPAGTDNQGNGATNNAGNTRRFVQPDGRVYSGAYNANNPSQGERSYSNWQNGQPNNDNNCVAQDVNDGDWETRDCQNDNNTSFACEQTNFRHVGTGYCRATDCQGCVSPYNTANRCVYDMEECEDWCRGYEGCVGIAFAARPTNPDGQCPYGEYAPRCVIYTGTNVPEPMGTNTNMLEYQCWRGNGRDNQVANPNPSGACSAMCGGHGGQCSYCGDSGFCCQQNFNYPAGSPCHYTMGCDGYACCVEDNRGEGRRAMMEFMGVMEAPRFKITPVDDDLKERVQEEGEIFRYHDKVQNIDDVRPFHAVKSPFLHKNVFHQDPEKRGCWKHDDDCALRHIKEKEDALAEMRATIKAHKQQ